MIFRISVVGDPGVGKSTLLFAYALEHNPFSIPDVYKKFFTQVKLGDKIYGTVISSHSTVEGLDVSTAADVVILCFDVRRSETLRSAQETWIPAIKSTTPSAQILLAGLKGDLREIYKTHKRLYFSIVGEKPVKKKTARKVTNTFGNGWYMECCGYRAHEVTALLERAVKIALVPKEKNTMCCVM
uniref:Ras family protein n=1 Tax=Steinernema glaseri TaxID=37863 RepID=A0A1I7Y748_9BILA